MPEHKSRFVRVVEGAWVPQAERACGRVGDDGDVMAMQPVWLALRLLSRWATCMAASWCTCMAWGIVPPRASVWCSRCGLSLHVLAHELVGADLVVRGGDLSCEVETCRARWRLLVQGEDLSGVRLVGSWSEMQPTGRRLDVLPVWVLNRVLTPPYPESLPWRCQSWPSHCQSWPSRCHWC
jgi:hypothetical protein